MNWGAVKMLLLGVVARLGASLVQPQIVLGYGMQDFDASDDPKELFALVGLSIIARKGFSVFNKVGVPGICGLAMLLSRHEPRNEMLWQWHPGSSQ